VLTGVQGISSLTALVNQLVSSGVLSSGSGNSLLVSLNAAADQLANGNAATAKNQLQAFLSKVDSMVQTGKLTTAQGAALTALAQRIIAAI
jgi:tape measure domain-containing protein